MAEDLRILYVTDSLRSAPQTGCAIRTLRMCRLLRQCGKVTCVAVENFFNEQAVLAARQVCDAFVAFSVRDYRSLPPWRRNLAIKWDMHRPGAAGFRVSCADQKVFDELLVSHDLVWFHTPAAAMPFGGPIPIASVMDLDDLMHCKYQHRARQDKTLRLRLSARVQAYKWRCIETEALKRYSAVVVCSRQDRALLGDCSTIHIIPNGFDMPPAEPIRQKPDGCRLGFIGALAYHPNQEGLRWFGNQVWPLIRRQKPDMRFRIVGTIPPDADFLKADGFDALGYVPDPTQEFAGWSALAVPLTFAGGTRIKILEAFSRKCPVVSTSMGAYGIEAQHNQHLLLADSPDEFARACLQLCQNPDRGAQLAENAWRLFAESYTWDKISGNVRSVVESVIGARG